MALPADLASSALRRSAFGSYSVSLNWLVASVDAARSASPVRVWASAL